MSDAFEQRRTRQPIPIESWGPRPPSRAGQKSAPWDTEESKKLSVSSRSSSTTCVTASPSKAAPVTGTWASARPPPRSSSETRKSRDRRLWTGAATPEVSYSVAELGVGSALEHYHHHQALVGPR